MQGELDIAEKYYWKSSVLGYTFSLTEISNIYFIRANNSSDDKLKKEQLLKASSFLHIALKRGDLLSNFSIKMNNNIPLTANDNKRIEKLTNEYYNKLVGERENNGLYNFDNSYPKALEVFASRL